MQKAKNILTAARKIRAEVKKIKELKVLSEYDVSINHSHELFF